MPTSAREAALVGRTRLARGSAFVPTLERWWLFSQFKVPSRTPCPSTAAAFLTSKAPSSSQKLHVHGKKGAQHPSPEERCFQDWL